MRYGLTLKCVDCFSDALHCAGRADKKNYCVNNTCQLCPNPNEVNVTCDEYFTSIGCACDAYYYGPLGDLGRIRGICTNTSPGSYFCRNEQYDKMTGYKASDADAQRKKYHSCYHKSTRVRLPDGGDRLISALEPGQVIASASVEGIQRVLLKIDHRNEN
jgi:hypothetical protein